MRLKIFIAISSSFEIEKTKICEIIKEYKKTNSRTRMEDRHNLGVGWNGILKLNLLG